jgi:hypothetical protein
MANQTKQTKDKSTYNQKDAKKTERQGEKGQPTPIKPSLSEPEDRGKCPPGQIRNPETGRCE